MPGRGPRLNPSLPVEDAESLSVAGKLLIIWTRQSIKGKKRMYIVLSVFSFSLSGGQWINMESR